eukprot:SAG25_NODE_1840_length_2275_cov_22.479779_2_plen_133_part_00
MGTMLRAGGGGGYGGRGGGGHRGRGGGGRGGGRGDKKTYHLQDGDLVANFFKLDLKEEKKLYAYDLSFKDQSMDRKEKQIHVNQLTKILFAAMHGATEPGGEEGFFKGKGKALREFRGARSPPRVFSFQRPC